MGLFGKPTLAQIYVKELRTRLDATMVPLFAPDSAVGVGAIGSFDRGQFVPTGSTLEDEFGISLPAREGASEVDWIFASEGAVDLTSEGTASMGGTELLKGKLSFRRDRAVVATFKSIRENSAVWTEALNRQIWELYLTERLPPTSVVVRTVRRAASGTVVVSRKSGSTLELMADPALLGGVLSIQGLAAGVTFTGGTQAAFQLSGQDLTPFGRVKGLVEASGKLMDVKGFQADRDAAGTPSAEMPDTVVDAVLGKADWDEPEDEESS